MSSKLTAQPFGSVFCRMYFSMASINNEPAPPRLHGGYDYKILNVKRQPSISNQSCHSNGTALFIKGKRCPCIC